MNLIYQNFDGLDVTFQGVLPEALLQQLEEARTEAQNNKQECYLELGPNKVRGTVAETGSPGGYRYRFDTGMDGETWFFAHSKKLDSWGIRVSVHSLSLAMYGYTGVKQRLLDRLAAFGANGFTDPILERVSRVDYCFDFLSTNPFSPDPSLIVAHQHCKKHCHSLKDPIETYTNTKGDKVQTVRIGQMPGRQITIYNKTAEIREHQKPYWNDIWKRASLPAGEVWRLEVRAGKKELDEWGLKRFADFEAMIGDVIHTTLLAMRYIVPSQDKNRSRWATAPFWQHALEACDNALAPYRCHADREKILNDHRLAVMNGYKQRIFGNMIGYAAASMRDPSEIEEVSAALIKEFLDSVKDNLNQFIEKYKQNENKFRFLS